MLRFKQNRLLTKYERFSTKRNFDSGCIYDNINKIELDKLTFRTIRAFHYYIVLPEIKYDYTKTTTKELIIIPTYDIAGPLGEFFVNSISRHREHVSNMLFNNNLIINNDGKHTKFKPVMTASFHSVIRRYLQNVET